MSLNIKLIFNQEIHRLTRLPSSYCELQQYIQSVTSYPFLTVRYLDEENDEITIACDSDLLTAYASAESSGLRNLRLHLSIPITSDDYPSNFSNIPTEIPSEPEKEFIWTQHTCYGCGTKPIIGTRYHCTICGDFDFCGQC